MDISTANRFQTVTDRADITNVINYKVAHGLSINMFRFDPGRF